MNHQEAAVAKALKAIEGVPYALRETAFTEALRSFLLTPSSTVPEHTTRGEHVESVHSETVKGDVGVPRRSRGPRAGDIYAAVTDATKVQRKYLELLFYYEDGEVEVALRKDQLGSTTAESARAVAQILAIVHQIELGEDGVELQTVRDACKEKHCYDYQHFAEHMKMISGFVQKGKGNGKRLTAQTLGISEFPNLVSTILEESIEEVMGQNGS